MQAVVVSEQLPWQTSSVHGSESGLAMHTPAKTPQSHFAPVPALMSMFVLQTVLSLLSQTSQW